MKVEELIKATATVRSAGRQDLEVRGVASDSRQVRPGFVFVAAAGAKHDGLDFIDDAVSRGAVAVVSEHDIKGRRDVCLVQVADARQAVGELAAAFCGWPSASLRVVGVTGTNGKTTTAYLIRDLLRAVGEEPGLVGTVEYRVGSREIPASRTTPEATVLQPLLAQMVDAGCGSAVMEVSSHALVQKRTAGVEFDVGVFTNLTRDHLDYHGNMEAYFEAKSLLFRALGRGGKTALAVVNVDAEWGRRIVAMEGLQAEVLTYGIGSDAAVRAESLELTASGSAFVVRTPWGASGIRTRLLGRFNVSNVLAAVAVGGALGVPLKDMAAVLCETTRVPGRLEEVPTGRPYQVFVDYAHTDDALENVLTTVREIIAGRLILVFGCGGERDSSKRSPMGEVAARLADHSIITSDNPRKEEPSLIIAQIREGFGAQTNFEVIEDRREAILAALAKAGEGDVVLIAGKGHETFQEFSHTTAPFDDREVVRTALGMGA